MKGIMQIQSHLRALITAVLMTVALQTVRAQDPPQGATEASPQNALAPTGKAFPQDAKRRIWFRHLKALPTDIRTAGLHIEIPGADQMTQRVTALFHSAGYNMVTADQAKYRYQLRGGFASEGKLKTQVPLAEILQGVEVTARSNASAVKAAGDVAFATVLADQVLKAGLTSPLWASGDILNAVLTATGLRDNFNISLTGDRRGVCLVGCTYWEWSDQSVGLSWRDPRIEGMSTANLVNVGVFAEGVYAEELTTLAVNEFLRHHGVISVPAPEGEAQLPIKELRDVLASRIKRTRELLE